MVKLILDVSNAERAKVGLQPLRLAPGINPVAQKWTQQMAVDQYMAHNPSYVSQMPPGWYRVGENVAAGWTPAQVTEAWMNSPGHRANILGDFTHIGIGYWVDDKGYPWYTQNFGKYIIPAPPAAITGLTTTVDKTSFTSSWAARPVENTVSHSYRIDLYSADGSRLLDGYATNAPTVTFSGLTDNTTYVVKVTAVSTDAAAVKYYSPVTTYSVTTRETPPTVGIPANLTVDAAETSLNASWSAPAFYGTLKPYKVEVKKGTTVVSTYETTATSHKVTGLAADTEYTVSVTATAVNGTNTATAVATATSRTSLSSVAEVSAPTNVTATASYGEVKATWGAPAVQKGTNVSYGVALKSGTGAVVGETWTTDLTHTFPAADNTAYTVTVTASINSQNGMTTTYSAPATSGAVTTPAAPPAPPAPPAAAPNPVTGLTASAVTYNSASLSWTAPTGVTGTVKDYNVTVKEAGKTARVLTTTTPSITLPGLTALTSYGVSVIANVTSGTTTATSPAASTSLTTPDVFKDITGNGFHKEIAWMKLKGISTGYEDGTYRPYDTVTREAMAAFMYRMAGKPAYTPPAVSPYVDVPTDHGFYKEIAWMRSAGLSNGWIDGTYRPIDQISREAMAAFMHRYSVKACSVNLPVSKSFVDAHYSGFAADIAWMGGAGVSTGYEDGTYRPFDYVTREAMAAFMFRLDSHIEANGGCVRP